MIPVVPGVLETPGSQKYVIPNYWQTMGKLMDNLVKEGNQNPIARRNIALSHNLGFRLWQETTSENA